MSLRPRCRPPQLAPQRPPELPHSARDNHRGMRQAHGQRCHAAWRRRYRASSLVLIVVFLVDLHFGRTAERRIPNVLLVCAGVRGVSEDWRRQERLHAP